VSSTSGGWPKIKLDLTADECLVLPGVVRQVFHSYTDCPDDGIQVLCYAYEEIFAEKLRALVQRTRPATCMMWFIISSCGKTSILRNPSPRFEAEMRFCRNQLTDDPTLTPYRPELEKTWETMLTHQLPVLPSLGSFWDTLPELFAWIEKR